MAEKTASMKPVLRYRTKVFFVGEENHKGYCYGLGCPDFSRCRVPWKRLHYSILDEWGYGD